MSADELPRAIDLAIAAHGEEDVRAFQRTIVAMRAMIRVFDSYMETEDGSVEERVCYEAIKGMCLGLQGRPEHAEALIFSLLSLIHSLREGVLYEDWLREAGVDPDGQFDVDGS